MRRAHDHRYNFSPTASWDPLRVALLLVALSALPTAAVDLRFGTDGLPYLARNASLVIQADRVRDVPPPTGCRLALYEITWNQALVGEPELDELLIALPKALDVPRAATIERAVLFLEPPMSEADRTYWQVNVDRPVREVVSGRFGVVPIDDDGQVLDALLRYLGAPDGEERLAWAERYATSHHIFLQRSAVLELRAPGRSLSDERAQRLLERSLTAASVALGTKRTSLQLLASTASLRAFETLRSVAEAATEDLRLRVQAVDAIDSFAAGAEVLREWELRGDVLGSAAVRSLERRLERERYALGAEHLKGALEFVPGEDVSWRRTLKAQDLEEITRSLIDSDISTVSARVEQIESLGRLASAEAREILRRLLTATTIDEALLDAAIRSLGEAERSSLPDTLDAVTHDALIQGLESHAAQRRITDQDSTLNEGIRQ